jgi:hypothetical protein
MDRIGDGDEIARLVARQDAQTLAQVLLELAEDYPPVYQRLERLRLSDDPAALRAQFTQQVHRWENDPRYPAREVEIPWSTAPQSASNLTK